jgi:hypothetical protein
MSALGLNIWLITVLLVALVIVPVAISLLSKTLKHAKSIERYLSDMLNAGVPIVSHTAAIPAVDNLIAVAKKLKANVEPIESGTGSLAELLVQRANGRKP